MSAPVGSLGAEAALLLDAIAGRLEALRPVAGDRAPGDDQSEHPAATGSPAGCPQCGHDASATVTCTACPVCRLLAVLRGERPETTARLVEGALVVVQTLRALLPEPTTGGGEPGPRSADEPSTTGPTVASAAPPAPAGPTVGGLERIIVR